MLRRKMNSLLSKKRLSRFGAFATLKVKAVMTSTPESIDVSIIIVNWNTRDVLRECLQSVYRGLGALNAEVLVVDNGSTDQSPEMVAQEFPQVGLIANPDNRGFAAANNQALSVARGRYFLLLNSDTIVLADVLTASLKYMDANRKVGVLGCRVLNDDGSVQLTCSRFPTLVNLVLLTSGLFRLSKPRFCGRYQILDWQRDSERDVDTVTGCYMWVRREAVEDTGLLDESFFFYGEETDWCKRFWKAGWKLRFAPVGEIVHYGSLSSRKCNHRRDVMLTSGLVRFHRKHGGIWPAIFAWLTLGGFCLLRATYWSVLAMWLNKDEARQRRDHFFGVLRDFRSTWPNEVEASV